MRDVPEYPKYLVNLRISRKQRLARDHLGYVGDIKIGLNSVSREVRLW